MAHNGQKRRNFSWTPESERQYTRTSIEKARPGSRRILRKFAAWLEAERGLGLDSIRGRVTSARDFVDWVARRGRSVAAGFRALNADGVERFFVGRGNDHGKRVRRSRQTAMRLFLRFTASLGWTSAELADAVPTLRSYRLSNLPRGISDRDLSTMLSSLDSACARDRAIAHLLVSYGVRRQQISALRLQDIDWTQLTVTFVGHKGGKTVQHALTPVVASSLAAYLHRERPAVDGDALFLRRLRPYLRMSPACVTEMVRVLMERAGLPPRSPHALRHAFATRLLAAGQSLKTIADLLGHRSLSTVDIYAKVDHARLLEVAGEWPEVVS